MSRVSYGDIRRQLVQRREAEQLQDAGADASKKLGWASNLGSLASLGLMLVPGFGQASFAVQMLGNLLAKKGAQMAAGVNGDMGKLPSTLFHHDTKNQLKNSINAQKPTWGGDMLGAVTSALGAQVMQAGGAKDFMTQVKDQGMMKALGASEGGWSFAKLFGEKAASGQGVVFTKSLEEAAKAQMPLSSVENPYGDVSNVPISTEDSMKKAFLKNFAEGKEGGIGLKLYETPKGPSSVGITLDNILSSNKDNASSIGLTLDNILSSNKDNNIYDILELIEK